MPLPHPRPPPPAYVLECAERARAGLVEDHPCLCEPFSVAVSLTGDKGCKPLVAWGVFNPFGPTFNGLTLVPVPDAAEHLLFLRVASPFSDSAGVLYGLIPNGTMMNLEQLYAVLYALFQRNGTDEYPLVGGVTHVIETEVSPFTPLSVRELFWLALQRGQLPDIDAESDRLVRYQGDPWGRAREGFDAALAPAGGLETQPSAATTPPSRAQFHRWWALVTCPTHVNSEVAQMEAAWKGALRYAAGKDVV